MQYSPHPHRSPPPAVHLLQAFFDAESLIEKVVEGATNFCKVDRGLIGVDVRFVDNLSSTWIRTVEHCMRMIAQVCTRIQRVHSNNRLCDVDAGFPTVER